MIKLLKVQVVPVFVEINDDGDAEEIVFPAITVPGKGWAEFAASAFGPDDLALAEQQVAEARAAKAD